MADESTNGTTSDTANICTPVVVAPFSPAAISSRSTFQAQQKSPLLVATPPQITRALSHAYPFLLFFNRLAGLLTWTSGDPWESFLLLTVFWGGVLYGDVAINLFFPLFLFATLALPAHVSAQATTLDEILATMTSLSARVDIFLEPYWNAAAMSPGFRILAVAPVWWGLAATVVTPRRLVLMLGTLMLSYHSKPAKVVRTVLWRSTFIRGLLQLRIPYLSSYGAFLTGAAGAAGATKGASTNAAPPPSATTSAPPKTPGVKFTFIIYENNRRWLGVGWTSSLFSYERAPWTDEHLVPCPVPDEFVLPEAGPGVKWRWVSEWKVDGQAQGEGWVYYDNKVCFFSFPYTHLSS